MQSSFIRTIFLTITITFTNLKQAVLVDLLLAELLNDEAVVRLLFLEALNHDDDVGDNGDDADDDDDDDAADNDEDEEEDSEPGIVEEVWKGEQRNSSKRRFLLKIQIWSLSSAVIQIWSILDDNIQIPPENTHLIIQW